MKLMPYLRLQKTFYFLLNITGISREGSYMGCHTSIVVLGFTLSKNEKGENTKIAIQSRKRQCLLVKRTAISTEKIFWSCEDLNGLDLRKHFSSSDDPFPIPGSGSSRIMSIAIISSNDFRKSKFCSFFRHIWSWCIASSWSQQSKSYRMWPYTERRWPYMEWNYIFLSVIVPAQSTRKK